MPSPADFFPAPTDAAAQPPRACTSGPTPTAPPDLLRTNRDARRASSMLQAWGRRHFRFTGPNGCSDAAFVVGQWQALMGLPKTGVLDAATTASVQQELTKAEPRFTTAMKEWSHARGAARMPGLPTGETLIDALRKLTAADLGRDLDAPACSLPFMTDHGRMQKATLCVWPAGMNGMLVSKEEPPVPDDGKFTIIFWNKPKGTFQTADATGVGTLRGRKWVRYDDDVTGTAETLLPKLQPLLGPPLRGHYRTPVGVTRNGDPPKDPNAYVADVDTYEWMNADVKVKLSCPGWIRLEACSLDVRLQ